MAVQNSPRLKVAHVTPAYWPATRWGGPIFSTKALCDGLAATGETLVSVLTTDAAGPRRRDRLDGPRVQVFPAGYEVSYARRLAGRDISAELARRLVPFLQQADIVHLTATYSFPTLPTLAVAKALRKPLVWSPRGALQARQQWDLAQSRKKVAFERIARLLAPRRMMLHVTSETELALSTNVIPAEAVVIPNAVEIGEDPGPRDYRSSDSFRLVFLSRVHPKKGIETALTALTHLPAGVTLAIYGDGEPAYLAELRAMANNLGITDRVSFHGHVVGPSKARAFQSGDVFVLPSYSENFGIVVAEAMANRTVVVTTTATPWDHLEGEGCGLSVAPGDAHALSAAIRSLGTRDLAAMAENGRQLVQERYTEAAVAQRMLAAYRALLAQTAAP